jgi:hypothetical protein
MHADRTSNPPLAIAAVELHESTCLRCRQTVWSWEHCKTVDHQPATFDRETIGREELLSLHGCHFEPSAEDLDDPDWGWIDTS